LNIDASSIAVIVSFGLSAWAMYSFGFRAKSVPVALALVGIPVAVWLACNVWLYGASVRAGYPPLLGAVPAIATYVAVLWIVYREIGGFTYRVGEQVTSFGRDLVAADQALARAYQEHPPLEDDGMIDAGRLRARLDSALAEFRTLNPPSGRWTRLVEQRAELHAAYVAPLTSPAPVGSDVTRPLEDRSRAWMSEVQALIREDEGKAV
jgi:hypothetical protein